MLGPDDRAQMLRDTAEMRTDAPVLLADEVCEIWRSPDKVGNKVLAPVQVLDEVPIHIRALQVEGTEHVANAPVGLSGARITHIGRIPSDYEVLIGDEIRMSDGMVYKVEGSNTKKTLRTVTLNSQPKKAAP